VMNYLFQLDLLGPNQAVAFSNQTLTMLNEGTAGSITQLTATDIPGQPATFPTSAWYVPYTAGATTANISLKVVGDLLIESTEAFVSASRCLVPR